MTYRESVARLDAALRATLPGPAAHSQLAPSVRREWPAGFRHDRIKLAAGLLAIFPHHDRAHIVLTLRSSALRHGGQVSLPGGAVDPGETFEQAALREAQEEIGLDPSSARVLGALTPLDIPVSGFRLHPIVASLGRKPAWTPNAEVARVIDVAVDDLVDPASIREIERTRDGHVLLVPGFHLAGVEIWGATAMVLAEFLNLLGWKRDGF